MEVQNNPNWDKIEKEKRKVMIECDMCKHHFNMSDIQPETITMNVKNNVLTVDFWRCPKCKHAYVVMLKDKRMRIKLQQQEDHLYQVKKKYGDGMSVPKSMLNQVQKVRLEINDLEEKLKDTYLEIVTAQLQKEAE